MNTRVRQPPLEENRELERFFEQVYRILSKVGSTTVDVGSVAAGATAEFTISVPGATVGSGVVLSPPAALEADLMAFGRVSAADVVMVRVLNPTASPIDPVEATWTVRVME